MQTQERRPNAPENFCGECGMTLVCVRCLRLIGNHEHRDAQFLCAACFRNVSDLPSATIEIEWQGGGGTWLPHGYFPGYSGRVHTDDQDD